MKDYEFQVNFGDDAISVRAGSKYDAIILACADHVRAGLHTDIQSVVGELPEHAMYPNSPKHCIKLTLAANCPA